MEEKESPTIPAELMSFSEAVDHYPLNMSQLLYCVLTGKIDTRKVNGHTYVVRESINKFFEEQWEQKKEEIKDEIIKFRKSWYSFHEQGDFRQGKFEWFMLSTMEVQKLRKEMLEQIRNLQEMLTDESGKLNVKEDMEILREKVKKSLHAMSKTTNSIINFLFTGKDKED